MAESLMEKNAICCTIQVTVNPFKPSNTKVTQIIALYIRENLEESFISDVILILFQ